MSLGSRIASRGQAAIRASLTSTPREPLSFQYLAWNRKSSTVSPGATVIQVDKESKSSNDPFAKTAVSSNSTARAGHLEYAESFKYSPRDDDLDPNALPSTGRQKRKDSTLRETPKPATTNNSRGLQKDSGRNQTQEYIALPIEKKVRRLLTKTALSEHTERTRLGARKAYQRYKTEESRSWQPDWRVILADLAKHTPQHGEWMENAVIMTVPMKSTAKLFHGLDDNVWDIASRHDCSVGLGPRDTTTDSYNTFILSGSAISISKSTADILGVAPGVEIKASSKNPPGQGDDKNVSMATIDTSYTNRPRDGSLRNVVTERRRVPLKLPAQKIPKPSEWDTASFYDYVCNLTCSEVPSHLHRFMYKRDEDHTTAVANVLGSLFANPQYRPFISRAACNKAMAYFVSTNRIEDARVLFVHMEMMKLQMGPEIFNSLLRGAAKSNDLHNFHFILHLMLRNGFSPNAETWTAFMTTIIDLRIQLYLLAGMRDKGLLQYLPAIRGTCELLAIAELESSLAQEESQEDFLAHMDSRYGPHWLGVNTGNRILHALGARGLISRCWEFLFIMESRMIKSDNFSVNTILHHCKQGSNLVGAVEVLKAIPSSSTFSPDEETYRVIFEMAWRSRSYNVARVVWRYACLSAATTFRMRILVLESLKRTTLPAQSESSRHRFNELAGEFIIGRQNFDQHPAGFLLEQMQKQLDNPRDNITTAADVSDAVINDLEPKPKLGSEGIQSISLKHFAAVEHPETNNVDFVPSREIRLERAKYLTDSDYKVFQDWEAVKPFSVMLVEAFERDKAWKRDEKSAKKKNDLSWMFQNAVHVPVRSKQKEKSDKLVDLKWT